MNKTPPGVHENEKMGTKNKKKIKHIKLFLPSSSRRHFKARMFSWAFTLDNSSFNPENEKKYILKDEIQVD